MPHNPCGSFHILLIWDFGVSGVETVTLNNHFYILSEALYLNKVKQLFYMFVLFPKLYHWINIAAILSPLV